MKALQIDFEAIPANIDEQAVQVKNNDQDKRVRLIAKAKAKAVQEKYPHHIIVAADTYIVMADEVLEKPSDLKKAKTMLKKQSGQKVRELTGFCYLDAVNKIEFIKTVAVDVEFRNLTESEIENYVATQPVLNWSAAFCPAYDSGATLIKSINGSLTGFTHGLPLEELIPLLQQSAVLWFWVVILILSATLLWCILPAYGQKEKRTPPASWFSLHRVWGV